MADSAEDIFGPGVLSANIDELAASRTQAATTASQTISMARQLIDEHNKDLNAHSETTAKYANSIDPGIVIIDETMESTLDYAVPNTTAIKNFVGEIVSSALTYAGQLDISLFNTVEKTINISKAVKKGNVFIISGQGSIEFNGHIYSAEDYIIAKNAIAASSEKSFTSFDWFNIQDTDVVKLNKSQNLTNKNLTSTTNVYRDATDTINGAVFLAQNLDDIQTTSVPSATLVKSKLSEKLTTIDGKATIGDSTEFATFTPLSDSGLNISHLNAEGHVFNITAIHETSNCSGSTVIQRTIHMPWQQVGYLNSEFLVTQSYVDNLNIANILKPNKDVATPEFINGYYHVVKYDETTVVCSGDAGITNQNASKNDFEDGYKVSWSGNYKWQHSDSEFDPTRWTYSGFTLNVVSGIEEDNLPPSGETSDIEFRLGIDTPVSTNTSGTITLFAPKSGLIVSGSNVVPAYGENEKSTTLSIGFIKKFFWGYSINSIPTASEILSWSNGTTSVNTTKFSSQRIPTSGVMADPGNNNSFMFIAYPESIADLASIKVTLGSSISDATSAFTKLSETVAVTSPATGKITNYKIYRSNTMSSTTGTFFNIS